MFEASNISSILHANGNNLGRTIKILLGHKEELNQLIDKFGLKPVNVSYKLSGSKLGGVDIYFSHK